MPGGAGLTTEGPWALQHLLAGLPRPVLAYGPQARWQSSKMGAATGLRQSQEVPPIRRSPPLCYWAEARHRQPVRPLGSWPLRPSAPCSNYPSKRLHSLSWAPAPSPLHPEWLYPDTTGQVTPTPNLYPQEVPGSGSWPALRPPGPSSNCHTSLRQAASSARDTPPLKGLSS